jgi:hypothetical protein
MSVYSLKSTNWLDEIQRTKNHEEMLYSKPHLSSVKIKKQNERK